jgi:hypothetical protein
MLLLVVSIITSLSIHSVPSPPSSESGYEPVAVIELFTSQGCSSCPPADKLLSETISNAGKQHQQIFAMEFHVDYWNRLGWSDPFSDAKFSERQRDYANKLDPQSIYTPQMIVNGSREFVGSDRSALQQALSKALKTSAAVTFKSLKVEQLPGKNIHVNYEVAGDYTGCTVNFALVSAHETTEIKRGENGGRTLNNENVVRQLLTAKAAAEGDAEFSASPVPSPAKSSVIAFVQRTTDLSILGAASAFVQ